MRAGNRHQKIEEETETKECWRTSCDVAGVLDVGGDQLYVYQASLVRKQRNVVTLTYVYV
jgi:hypothetical protein